MEKLRKPAAWEQATWDDILQCEAGRAYLLDQLDARSQAIPPEHVFRSDHANCDAARYEIFDDDSFWCVNNSEDQIWVDFRDFVNENLLGTHKSPGYCWDQAEYEACEHNSAWLIDAMDKQLLILFCDGDEQAAQELFNDRWGI